MVDYLAFGLIAWVAPERAICVALADLTNGRTMPVWQRICAVA